jgi:hypothetical protein
VHILKISYIRAFENIKIQFLLKCMDVSEIWDVSN